MRDAHSLASDGLELAERRGWTELAQAIAIYLVLAILHLERNDLVESQRLLDAGFAAQRNDPERVPLLALLATRARLLVATGHLNEARGAITAWWSASEGWGPPVLARRWLAVADAEVSLATG